MSLQNHKLLFATVLSLMAGLEAMSPVLASPLAKQLHQQSVSQAASYRSSAPFADVEVHGRIVGIDGEQVQLRRDDGALVVYTLPGFDQQRYELAAGSEVRLTVRAADNTVVAIRNVSQSSAPGNTDRIPVADIEVHGRVVGIDGEQVQLRRKDGELGSYTIPEFDQRRAGLALGSEVTLTVRAADNAVVAINPVASHGR